MPDERSLELADQLLAVSNALVRSARSSAGEGLGGDVSLAQMRLLRLVRERPRLSVAEAAEQLRLAANTISTLVAQLLRAGLLQRVPDPADGRVVRLQLAPEAEQRMAAWRGRRLDAVSAAVRDLDTDERDLLGAALPVLARLAASLEGGARPSSG